MSNATNTQPLAAMSIDVEDWFQVENLKGVVARDTWDERELRVERNTDRMLELMDNRGVTGTCFVLGWVAEKCPALIKRIADAGHELASHGYGHDLIYSLSQDEFREDIKRGKGLVEDLTGAEITGYRAPSFSITDWAIDILHEQGITYDSSAFPTVAHDRYGKITGMRAGVPVQEIRPGFHEVCVSVLQMGKKGLPWAGGGYFRLYPYAFTANSFWRINHQQNEAFMFYVHPWEVDVEQQRMPFAKGATRFRHYVNLHTTEHKLRRLLRGFSFGTISDVLRPYVESTQQNLCKT